MTTQDYSSNALRRRDTDEAPVATPDGAADYVWFLDATDGEWKRVLINNLPGGGGGGGAVEIQNAGTVVGSQPAINFQVGGDLSMTVVDDAANSRVNVTYSRIKTPAETALSATAVSGDQLPYYDSTTTASTTTLTSFARSFLDDATAGDVRTTLGIDPDYVKANGTVPFTAPVAGATPVGINDLTTKNYVDTADVVLFTYHSNASNLSSGTVPTARLASGTASSSTYLRGDQTWATVAAGGDDIVYADPTMKAVAMSTTYAVLGEKTITVSAGDLVEVHCSGTLENNSGATKVFRWKIEVIANGNTETLEIQDGTTVATSATNKAAWLWRSSSTITASQCHTVALSTRSAPSSPTATGASTSGSTIRMQWAQDANDYTGSCTLRLSGRVTAATTNTFINVQHFWIQQTPVRP